MHTISCVNNNKEINNNDIVSDSTILLTNNKPISVIKNNDSIVDIDGNVYHSITIGTQTWMVENLKVTKYSNGEKISNITDYSQWSELTLGAYCDYLNVATNSDLYGHIYNWNAVNDNRKIAPKGWHVATEVDWTTLFNYLGGNNVAGGKMKEEGKDRWEYPNSNATNESGFTALPSGVRSSNGEFGSIERSCTWWADTKYNESNAICYSLDYSDAKVERNDNEKTFGFSVRCIKD